MNTVTVKTPRGSCVMANSVDVGTIGYVTHGAEECLVMRTYSGMVDLRDPSRTWDVSGTSFHYIRLLPSGTVVEIVVD